MNFTSGQQLKIKEAVDLELSHHPQASLKDIYKNFFQDQFGPGHIIYNPQKAFDFLNNEIKNAYLFDSMDFHYLGYQHQFVRINLKLIKDQKIPIEEFFRLFIESTQSIKPVSVNDWHEKWKDIILIIKEMNLNIQDYDKDELQIEENLQNGIYVGHHSDSYEKLYHPHYRIIDIRSTKQIRSMYNL
jgi:hypothetical protein